VHPLEQIAVAVQRLRHAFDHAQFACRSQLAHLRDGGGRSTKFSASMYQRDAAGLRRQRQRPIKRGIAATEDDQLAAVKIAGVLDT
jgi:hypothetical protein